MPDPNPITPQPRHIEVGATPLYFRNPIDINGTDVSQILLQPAGRPAQGIESAVLLVNEQSRRRGEENRTFSKPMANVTQGDQIEWGARVAGVQWVDEQGQPHVIPRDQLSLDPPSLQPPVVRRSEPTQTPPLEQLEKRVVMAGVKTKERRVYDLVNKSMERAKGWGKQAFKEVFEHKLTQHYTKLLDAVQTPFAEEAIRMAEQKAEQRYDTEQQSKNLLSRKTREAWEGIKAFTFGRTLVQEWTIQELTNVQDTAIRDALERGRQMYLDEKGAFSGRFDTAFDREDLAIRKDMGENFSQVAAQPYNQEIKTLIKQFVHGDIDEATFAAHKDALWGRIKTANPDLLKDAEDYADTLTAIGKQYQDQWNRPEINAEDKLRIDGEIEAMRVALGIGQMGEATSMNKTDTQKAVGKLKEFSDFLVRKNIIGASLFNEATVGTAVSYALSVKSFGSMVATSSARAMGGLAAGGAAAGVFGAAREKGRLTAEYWSYLGEKEAGVQTVAGSKKREWFDKLDITRRKSDEVVSALRANLYDSNGAVKTRLTDEEVRSTLGQLADAKARWALSSRKEKRVGLIEIGGLGGQERNRTEFVRTMDQVEKDLGTYVAGNADVKTRLMAGQEYNAFLDGLTTTQTQILEKGKATFDALQQDSAQRLALTHVAGYTPEVEKLRRKIMWLYGKKHTVGTASGLEAALKEFHTQANVEAARRGIATAGIGMGIGAIAQEAAMDAAYYKQFGWQGLDTFGHGAVADLLGVEHALPLADVADVIPGPGGDNLVTPSQNLEFDGKFYDLVDRSGNVIKPDVIEAAKLQFANGELTDGAKDYVAVQMKTYGFEATFSADAFSHVPFTGPHPLPFGKDTISVPNELHWVENGDGTSRLVLDIQNGSGIPSEHVIVVNETLVNGSPQNVDDVLKAIDNDPWFEVAGGGDTVSSVPVERIALDTLPHYTLADGSEHILHANIPDGTKLVETSDGVYRLVSEVDPNKTLLANIKIDDTGFITNLNEVEHSALAQANHFDLSNTDYTVQLEGGGGGGFFDKPVIEMGEEKGFHGIWGWVEDPVNASGDISNKIPGTNYVKHMARTLYENDFTGTPGLEDAHFVRADGTIVPHADIDWGTYTKMYTGDKFTNLPEVMFSDNAIVKMAAIEQRAIDMVENQGVNFATATPAALGITPDEFAILKAAYRIGRIGSEATKEEFLDLYKYMGGGPSSLELHAPRIVQELVSEGAPTISPVDAEVVNNIIQLRGPEDQIPIPVIPILGRRGLEAGVARTAPVAPTPEPPLYYSFEMFNQQSTLNNLIRIGSEDKIVQPRGGYMLNFRNRETTNVTEGEGATQKISDAFNRSEHIYVTLSGAIGDVVVATAYIDGLRQYAQKLGPKKRMTLVAPSTVSDLLSPLAKKYNFEIVEEERHKCVTKAHDLINTNHESNALVFDFDFTEENGPYPILEERENGNVTAHELFSTALGLYTNERSGDKRFGEYLGDLLHVPQNERIQLKPVLPLPENEEETFRGLVTRHGIDTSKRQIAVVVEGSAAYKRYDLEKWSTVLKRLTGDDVEINILYHETGHYTEQELHAKLGSVENARFLSLTLPEVSVLLRNQTLVLSNDTGLAHIATTVENGPSVISLHAYNNRPNIWVTNTDRQIGIWSGADNKDVDAIPPEEISRKALEILAR